MADYEYEELADEIVDRLVDFSPALTIERGEDDDQVEVHITMTRTSQPELRERSRRRGI